MEIVSVTYGLEKFINRREIQWTLEIDLKTSPRKANNRKIAATQLRILLIKNLLVEN